jgi:outer membrane protein
MGKLLQEFAVKLVSINKIFTTAATMALITLNAGAQTPAAAPNKVGVIQIQAALTATKEGQKAAAEMEVKFAPRKKELDAKQAEIKDMQDKLAKGGNTLSDSAKEELTRGVDAKTKSYNRDIEDAQAELEAEQQKILNGLGQKMMQVIDKYAQSNGFSVVLDVSNQNTPVLYASNSVDITKEIIDLYDKTVFTAVPAAAPVKPGAIGAAPRPTPAPAAAPKPPAVAPAKK